MPDNERLSKLQKAGLRRLLQLGAISEKKGVDTAGDPDLNVMAIGRLRRFGYVDSRVVSKKESGALRQFTKYWLTRAGMSRAQSLKKENQK